MRGQENEIRTAGAGLAAVGLGDRRYAQAFREETAIRFPLLVDERREAYQAAGLQVASVVDLARPVNLTAGFRAFLTGHRQHRTGPDPFQLGGTFIFAPGDVDLFAHVSRTFSDNAPPAELVKALRSAHP